MRFLSVLLAVVLSVLCLQLVCFAMKNGELPRQARDKRQGTLEK
jgi:hypothetical protein